MVCVRNLVTSEKSDDQINLTFSEVEEMWTRLTCDFVAVPDNKDNFDKGQVGHKHLITRLHGPRWGPRSGEG